MKILNLYSGIGGNRKLWGDEHDITAVEFDPKIAACYAKFFPEDLVVVGDAHQFLLDHYSEFDFIWSSPPCQSHSRIRFNLGFRHKSHPPLYPDMRLYQEVLFLSTHYKGKWLVENVNPYYKPLIDISFKVGRHCFWSNLTKPAINVTISTVDMERCAPGDLAKCYGFDLSSIKLPDKRKSLRNCVHPEIGKIILELAQ